MKGIRTLSLWLKTFRRHDNCGCSVTYEDGEMRQDAWSKRTWQASPEELAERKELEEKLKPVRFSPEEAAAKEREVLEQRAERLTNGGESGIIGKNNFETAVTDVHEVGKIDKEKYKVIATGDILTDEVIITDNQIRHIIERRGEVFYNEYKDRFSEIIADPDYIFKDDRDNTAIVSKSYRTNGKNINVILRLVVEGDNPNYKNSIITAIGENKKRFEQRLRNNNPVYKKVDKRV